MFGCPYGCAPMRQACVIVPNPPPPPALQPALRILELEPVLRPTGTIARADSRGLRPAAECAIAAGRGARIARGTVEADAAADPPKENPARAGQVPCERNSRTAWGSGDRGAVLLALSISRLAERKSSPDPLVGGRNDFHQCSPSFAPSAATVIIAGIPVATVANAITSASTMTSPFASADQRLPHTCFQGISPQRFWFRDW
jgi:hypothetical protein